MQKRPLGLVAFILIVAVVLTTAFAGCNQKKESKPGGQQSSTGVPKAPSSANDILKEIDTIVVSLSNKVRAEEAPAISEAQAEGQKGKSAKQSTGAPAISKHGSSSPEGQSSSSSSSKSASPSFAEEEKSLIKIHQLWNSLEPEAVAAGLDEADRTAFEDTLDELTRSVAGKKAVESMVLAADLYGKFGRVLRVFSFPVPQDYFQVKSGALVAMGEAARDDWTAASEHMNNIREPWKTLYTELKKVDAKASDRTEHAIQDLDQAIASQDKNLVAIKGEILMQDFKQIEKKLSKKSGS